MNRSRPVINDSDSSLATTSPWRTKIFATAVLMLSMTLTGCSGLDLNTPPEQVVRKLATHRWQALMSRDFEKAYEFSVPSYRQIRTAEYYRSKRQATPVQWLSAEVLVVECQKETCSVRIKLESKPIIPSQFKGTLQSGLDETWVFEDGRWWMLETL